MSNLPRKARKIRECERRTMARAIANPFALTKTQKRIVRSVLLRGLERTD